MMKPRCIPEAFDAVLRPGLMSSFLLFLLILTAFEGGKLGCGSDKKEQPDEILIGAIFALTGATSETGSMYAAGVRDCLRQVTEEGGIRGLPVRLVEKDSNYLLSKAISAYKELKEQYPIVAILSWGTGETEALSPLIRMDRIPCISGSFSSSLSDPKRTPYNFIGGATYQDQFLGACKYILEKSVEKKTKPRVALIYSDTAFGRAPFFPEGVKRASDMGIEIVDHIIIGLDETDATLQLSDLLELNLDYAIIQQTVAATAVLLKDAEKIGLKVPMIGLGWTMDEGLLETAEEAADGFYSVVTHPIWLKENKEEAKRILDIGKKYGHAPDKLGKNYIIGFCNGQLLIHALKRCAPDVSGPCIRRELEGIRQMNLPAAGISISFDSARHHPATPVWMFQVDKETFVPVGGPYHP